MCYRKTPIKLWRRAIFCALLLQAGVLAAEPGVEVEMWLQEKQPPQAGEAFSLSFYISGAQGGAALADLHPGGWIRPRIAGRSSCEDAVKGYLALGPNNGRDISLNGYTFITINSDHTLAVIDPQLNLATANLHSLTRLGSKAGAWQLDAEAGRLYITLPDQNSLVVVDAFTGATVAAIKTATSPSQLLLLAQHGDLLWLASGVDGVIQAIDVPAAEIGITLKVGEGAVQLALDEPGNRLFAYAEGNGGLLIVDSGNAGVLARLQLPAGLKDLRYSPLAERLLLLGDGEVVSVAPRQGAAAETRSLGGSASRLYLSPNGRWLLAAQGEQGVLRLLDLSSGNPTHQLSFRHPFDQVVFSEHYAYLRHTDVARASLIHMASLTPGTEPGVIDIPLGSKPPGSVAASMNLPAVAPLPEGGGAILVSPADQTLLLFMEDGMRAPMNSFRTWTAPPLAVKIHDRSLQERGPGVYQALTMVPRPGAYEVVFHLPNPALARCFPLDIAGRESDTAAPQPELYELKLIDAAPKAGENTILEFSVIDQQGKSTVPKDLQVLLFRPGGNWQHRAFVRPGQEGRFRLPVSFPVEGKYRIGVASGELGLQFQSRTMKTLEVPR